MNRRRASSRGTISSRKYRSMLLVAERLAGQQQADRRPAVPHQERCGSPSPGRCARVPARSRASRACRRTPSTSTPFGISGSNRSPGGPSRPWLAETRMQEGPRSQRAQRLGRIPGQRQVQGHQRRRARWRQVGVEVDPVQMDDIDLPAGQRSRDRLPMRRMGCRPDRRPGAARPTAAWRPASPPCGSPRRRPRASGGPARPAPCRAVPAPARPRPPHPARPVPADRRRSAR